MESEGWVPGDGVGASSEGWSGRVEALQCGEGGAIEDGQTFGQTGTPGSVAIFVPPAVFDEEVVVFDLPVVADVSQ